MGALDVGIEGVVAELKLNRPREGNALDQVIVEALRDSVLVCTDAGVRVVVIRAAGSLFCGGGDVRAMSTADNPSEYTHRLASTLHEALLAFARAPFVTVTEIQGPVAGAGLSLVANADFAIAGAKATFISAYSNLGVTPDGGASFLLPRLIGPRRTNDILFNGYRIDAETAYRWGLVSQAVADDELSATVSTLTQRLVKVPPLALAETKRLLCEPQLAEYEAHLKREADSIGELISSDDSKRLQVSFLDRDLYS